jgi:GT2 family glycosyltransferase
MEFHTIVVAPEPVTKILAVIVLYKMQAFESPSFATLLAAAGHCSTNQDFTILIRDNTPGGQRPSRLPPGCRYESTPNNPGLADAYNRGLEIAKAEGHAWLLTLDQDTILPKDYLSGMIQHARRLQLSPEIAAIVPHVFDNGTKLSPFRFAGGAVPRWFASGYSGIATQPTYAINSAALLRTSALVEIGGYDPMFPLDVSDIRLFHRLSCLEKKVFIAGDIRVDHDFSLLDKNARMSTDRYRSMLLDECAFWDMNMGPLARFERTVRLAVRACRDHFRPGCENFRDASLRELKRRLITTRDQRISEWTTWARARSAGSLGA